VDNIEKAAMVRVEGDRLTFDRLVDFPGGAKKFTIRYDSKTKRYWTLANPASEHAYAASVRTTLALLSSPDSGSGRTERIVAHPTPTR
jgi:hypothetical protein